MKKILVLVIDGLGVGAMDDVSESRRQDLGANTFSNIIKNHNRLVVPNLIRFGVVDYYHNNKFISHKTNGFNISLGKIKLAHFGADSYLGHQEMAGTLPKKPIRQFVRDIKEELIDALEKEGYSYEYKDFILVNNFIAIADNIETDYGMNINVVGSLDNASYSEIERVGRIVRKIAKVGRVITMGGKNLKKEDFYNSFEIKKRDGYEARGINIPHLKIYDDNYRVVHMGYGVDRESQVTQMLGSKNIPVVLIGKTADIIISDNAIYIPEVNTENVINHIKKTLKNTQLGFIFANIQETDLSGHEQNLDRYASLINLIDKEIPNIIELLDDDDIFIITGDHGNDPTIGHTNHTREKVPLIVFSKKIESKDIGERNTLADIGATVAQYFGLKDTESGSPIF